jgi:hypothetical protein
MAKGQSKTIGEWTWNSDVLWNKIQKTDDDSCWAWIGSRLIYLVREKQDSPR